MSEIEQRLRELRRELRDLSWRRRRRVLDEARDHLLSAVDDGRTPAEAVEQLGDPAEAFRGFPRRGRKHRAVTLAVPAALLALAPSIGGPLERIGATVPQSRAATPTPAQTLALQHRAVRACVAAWNAEPSGQLRHAVAAAGVRRADVYVIEIWKIGTPRPTAPSKCGVYLQPPPVPSPYQPTLRTFATPDGSSFTFGGTLLHGHVRSAAPAANARVSADGRIVLTDTTPPRGCPGGLVGTAVTQVEAAAGPSLSSTGVTRLSAAQSRSFTVKVVNDGRVAIQGPIVNLSFTTPDHPDRLMRRSLPRTFGRLAPGASLSVRFATASEPGTFLVRATTAAVLCETRVADNSRVFRIHVG